jgi:hypothetical protein
LASKMPGAKPKVKLEAPRFPIEPIIFFWETVPNSGAFLKEETLLRVSAVLQDALEILR